MTDSKPHSESRTKLNCNVPNWIQDVCGRIERELIRAPGEDFASEAELEQRLLDTTFKVLLERQRNEFPDSQSRYLRSAFRRQVFSAIQPIRKQYRSFSVERCELFIPNESGLLQPATNSRVSERTSLLAAIAGRDGRAISWNPAMDPRLCDVSGETAAMLAIRLDEDDEISKNVVVAIAGSVLPLADSLVEQILFHEIVQTSEQLRFTLHKCEAFWRLSDLFHQGWRFSSNRD